MFFKIYLCKYHSTYKGTENPGGSLSTFYFHSWDVEIEQGVFK